MDRSGGFVRSRKCLLSAARQRDRGPGPFAGVQSGERILVMIPNRINRADTSSASP